MRECRREPLQEIALQRAARRADTECRGAKAAERVAGQRDVLQVGGQRAEREVRERDAERKEWH